MCESTSRGKVVHLSSVHRASDTRIFVKECRSLAQAGYDVTLIAVAEHNYELDGVTVVAVGRGNGNRFRRMTFTTLDVYRRAKAADADIYHFHDPELIPVGLVLKLFGKRVIYDVHESVAKQIQTKGWIPRPLRKLVATSYRVLERMSATALDGVVAATPAIAALFQSSKTVIVHNFVSLAEFEDIDSDDYMFRERSAVYVGGLSEARGVREMIEATSLLSDGSRLILGGTFQPPSLESKIKNEIDTSRVTFSGWMHRVEVREALARARAGLLLLHRRPNYVESYPVKLFEYMAAGLPVVASDFPFWRQFIEDTEAGIMVDPVDPVSIAQAIEWLLDNPAKAKAMGERGRQAVLAHYSWESEKTKLLKLYEQMTVRS